MDYLTKIYILVFYKLILICHYGNATTDCGENLKFYTKILTELESRNLLFYAVSMNVSNVTDCANLCHSSEFCRSSVYFSLTNICKFSYSAGPTCSDIHVINATEFGSHLLNDNIVSIFCIKCPREIENGTTTNDRTLPSYQTLGHSTLLPLVTSTEPSTECFKQFKGKILPNVAFAVQKNYSIEQCQCVCSDTWNPADSIVKCKSFNYHYNSRECKLNFIDHDNDLFQLKDALDQLDSYFEFICTNDSAQTKRFIQRVCVLEPEVTKTFDTSEEPKFTLTTRVTNIPNLKNDQCFEDTPGYVLNGFAAELEHDLTFEQCKCLCADKEQYERFGFNCKSIMYYPYERGCIINAGSKLDNPKSFHINSTPVKLIYSDLLCTDESAQNYLSKCKSSGNYTRRADEISPSLDVAEEMTNQSSEYTTNELLTTNPDSPDELQFLSPTTPLWPCRYSTFYESRFDGRKLIERIVVDEPIACFRRCASMGCKSANVQNFLGKYKFCEIFRDAAVDYPSVNRITISADSFYFEGIQCQ